MVDEAKVLFFTYADSRYELFAIPYIYFALRNNEDSKVEICLEDYAGFAERNRSALQMLESLYSGRFLIRQSQVALQSPRAIPNTVRFVETPLLKGRYVYIGDIDLLVFDDVATIHEKLIGEFGVEFSNMLRPQFASTAKPRLSGLHFCAFDKYYPIPEISDLALSVENDEHVLYECMRRKGLMVPVAFQQRPECGIHMSLSRDPLGRTTGAAGGHYSSLNAHGWGGRHYYRVFLEQIREERFSKLLPHLDLELRLVLLAAEAMASDQSRRLHRAATSFLLDKRLLVSEEEFSLKQILDSRHQAIVDGKLDVAESIGMTLCTVWPNRIDVWFKQAWLWLEMDKPKLATEALAHIAGMQDGLAFLRSNDLVSVHRGKIAEGGPAGAELLKRVQLK
jgi:hypothetical protein